jgi:hypothetical protein
VRVVCVKQMKLMHQSKVENVVIMFMYVPNLMELFVRINLVKNRFIFLLEDVQCISMRSVGIDVKCIALPQYDLTEFKACDRVCYDPSYWMKRDSEGLDECSGSLAITFESFVPSSAPSTS